jgi:hypothetical protein
VSGGGGAPATAAPAIAAPAIAGEERVRRLVPVLLATWFVAISAMRLILIAPGGPGFDGRLYRSATVAWLQGQDPWSVVQGGVWFGAPPPSLLPMIPFALLPETLAVGLLLVLGLVGSVWAIRRLGLPIWWLAFPPLVDGIWNANPHVLVLPLLLLGLAPIATIVKLYAVVVPAIRLEVRALALTAVALVVTAPFVPWSTFLAERQQISERLDLTAGGGSSVFGLEMPLLPIGLAVAVVALVVLFRRDRERAAWLAMPAFWPWTQWYYASQAIPGVADRPQSAPSGIATVLVLAVAAAVLASPVEGAPVVALAIVAFGEPLVAAAGRQRAANARSTSSPSADPVQSTRADPPIAPLP